MKGAGKSNLSRLVCLVCLSVFCLVHGKKELCLSVRLSVCPSACLSVFVCWALSHFLPLSQSPLSLSLPFSLLSAQFPSPQIWVSVRVCKCLLRLSSPSPSPRAHYPILT